MDVDSWNTLHLSLAPPPFENTRDLRNMKRDQERQREQEREGARVSVRNMFKQSSSSALLTRWFLCNVGN